MGKDTLTIRDNRTGREYEVPISYATYPEYGASIPAAALRDIKQSADDFGLLTYDPAFMNTASCRSSITHIDGDAGILRYRGYDIADLALQANFLEVAYLLLNGELPNEKELTDWTRNITYHTMVHESVKTFMNGFHYDAHPMGIFVSTVAALSTFYPESRSVLNPEAREQEIIRLIAKVPTIAAYAYRHRVGMPYIYPDNDLSFSGNFLSMMFKMREEKYQPNPTLERTLDILFILHADHEQNCSTNAMRSIGSSQADPYVSLAGAAAALYGRCMAVRTSRSCACCGRSAP